MRPSARHIFHLSFRRARPPPLLLLHLLPPATDAQNTLYSTRNNCFCLEGVWIGAPLRATLGRRRGGLWRDNRSLLHTTPPPPPPPPPPPSLTRWRRGCHLSMGSGILLYGWGGLTCVCAYMKSKAAAGTGHDPDERTQVERRTIL